MGNKEPRAFLLWFLQEALGDSTLAVTHLWERILYRYQEGHRHYHTIDHIEEMVSFFLRHEGAVRSESPSTSVWDLGLAAIYHDIIYDPTKTDNEERSADALLKELSPWSRGVRYSYQRFYESLDALADWVRATKGHTVPRKNGVQWLIDADLMRFAAEPEQSRIYNADIRKEYKHLSDEQWAAGRVNALRPFAVREPFFLTDAFSDGDAIRARENILTEMFYWTNRA